MSVFLSTAVPAAVALSIATAAYFGQLHAVQRDAMRKVYSGFLGKVHELDYAISNLSALKKLADTFDLPPSSEDVADPADLVRHLEMRVQARRDVATAAETLASVRSDLLVLLSEMMIAGGSQALWTAQALKKATAERPQPDHLADLHMLFVYEVKRDLGFRKGLRLKGSPSIARTQDIVKQEQADAR